MLPKKVLTFKERRKRADADKIYNDFEGIESSFLSYTQKLNKKRQAQFLKRMNKTIPELLKAHESGDKEEVEGILKSIQLPSSKEWRKGIYKLVVTATETGILRAHKELLNLKELYEFNSDWTPEVTGLGYDYEVVIPEEAREYIRDHAYEVGVITEETVKRRIREALEEGLDEGLTPKEMTEKVKNVAGTWMSDFHAQTIARTETGKFYNAGRMARWLDSEAGDFVQALQYDAILDPRTTEICEHLDGKIIPISDRATIAEYTPPNHFQCRSTWLPVTKYEEWEPSFDTNMDPQEGFDFKSPLPKLLEGKKEPLVKPKPKYNPSEVTDPDIIRSLEDDDDFKRAIKNISDLKLKLSLIKERAEKVALRDSNMKITSETGFEFTRIYGRSNDNGTATFELYGKPYSFFWNGSIDDAIDELFLELDEVDSLEEAKKVFKRFKEDFGDDAIMSDFLITFDRALKEVGESMTWDGPAEVPLTEEAKRLFTIKLPPKTQNFKRAKGLQEAIKKGEEWVLKHVDSSLAPKTGIKLKFKYDLARAYAIGMQGTIHFGMMETDPAVIVHEMGHIMHQNSKEISDLIDEFYKQRTEGEKMTKYMGENTKRDDFYHPYAGRVYGWEKKLGKALGYNAYGQETFTMGIQAMFEDPEKFYKNDKEHFLVIYALMRGFF